MTLRYAWMALAILAAANGVLFPLLDGPGRAGLLAASAVTFLFQVAAFAVLARYAHRPEQGLLVWIGTTVVRMGVVIAVGLSLTWFPALSPVTTLLGSAGFFFVLLILEPVFLVRGRATAQAA